MIPKILHQVWLGPDPIPSPFFRFREQWRSVHPEWQYKLWTDRDVSDLQCQPLLSRVAAASSRSNIVRLEALYQFGGTYSDLDVEWLRNSDALLEYPGFAALEAPDRYGNAVFGAVRASPWIGWQLNQLQHYLHLPAPWGPTLLSRACRAEPEHVTAVPSFFFYPYTWNEGPFPGWMFPASYAVHHWAMSWSKSNRVERFSFPGRTEWVEDRFAIYERMPKDAVVAGAGINAGRVAAEVLRLSRPRRLHLVGPWEDRNSVWQGDQGTPLDFPSGRFGPDPRASFAQILDQLVVHSGNEIAAFSAFREGHFDWIYLDGNPTLGAVRPLLREALRCVKENGLLVLHNYVSKFDSPLARERQFGAVEAVAEFCKEFGWEICLRDLGTGCDPQARFSSNVCLRKQKELAISIQVRH